MAPKMSSIKNLCDVFKKAKELNSKTISLQVLPEFNLEELNTFTNSFCSLCWIYNNKLEISTIRDTQPITTLMKLTKHNKHVIQHLPCRTFTETEVLEILKILKECNVKNILALQGAVVDNSRKGDFQYAADLVKFIKKNYGDSFTIGVGAYPDVHPESPNAELDLMHLKEKIDAGADFVITQKVYDYKSFDDFYKKFVILCPGVPILVGIYVISSYESYNFAKRIFQKDLPQVITDFVLKHKDNNEEIRDFGIQLSVKTIQKVLSSNNAQVVGIHFFVWDDLDIIKQVCECLNLEKVHTEQPSNMNSYSFFTLKNKTF